MKNMQTSYTKKQLRIARAVIMCFRCKYIESDLQLRREHRTRLPAKFWRIYNSVKCFFNKEWETDILLVLKNVMNSGDPFSIDMMLDDSEYMKAHAAQPNSN